MDKNEHVGTVSVSDTDISHHLSLSLTLLETIVESIKRVFRAIKREVAKKELDSFTLNFGVISLTFKNKKTTRHRKTLVKQKRNRKRREILNLHNNRRQTRGPKMSEEKKCPKCGGEMEKGNLFSTPAGRFVRFTDRESESLWTIGNVAKVDVFACKSCGYVEIYKEMKKP